MRLGGGWGNPLPIQGHDVTGLLTQRLRLMLGAQFFLKSGQTLAIRRRQAIFFTEVQLIAQPVVIVGTLPGQDVLLRQPRPVAVDQLRGDGKHDGDSRVGRLAMNVILLVKASRIK
jgi:hypothetical protein